MIPCILACFNSDAVIHPDTYEPHVKLLFDNLGNVISFLAKGGNSGSGSASDTDGDDSNDCDPKDGYYAIKNELLEKIYLKFFSAERYEDTLLTELREKVVS